MMFDKKDMEELRRVFGAEHDPGPDPDEVRVPDGVWIDDEPHVSAELNPLISGIDFADRETGHLDLFLHLTNLVFTDPVTFDVDRGLETILTLARYLSDLLMGLDDESREDFLRHIDQLADVWNEASLVAWFDDELPAGGHVDGEEA